jgi:hypothetical protein
VGCLTSGARAFPAHLEEVRRFSEAWQGGASLLLRQGDPAAAGRYGDHGRINIVHPALLGDRVSRQHQQLSVRGRSSRASSSRREHAVGASAVETTVSPMYGLSGAAA